MFSIPHLFNRLESKFGLGPLEMVEFSEGIFTDNNFIRLVNSEANVDTENREISVPTDSLDGDLNIFVFCIT